MLERADKNIAKVQEDGRDNARRLCALILLLRYTGLRIGDAVSCSVDRFVGGKLRLYTQKTGAHVHRPLPDFVLRELESTGSGPGIANCKPRSPIGKDVSRIHSTIVSAAGIELC